MIEGEATGVLDTFSGASSLKNVTTTKSYGLERVQLERNGQVPETIQMRHI